VVHDTCSAPAYTATVTGGRRRGRSIPTRTSLSTRPARSRARRQPSTTPTRTILRTRWRRTSHSTCRPLRRRCGSTRSRAPASSRPGRA
jgi:hypothetical protein